MVGKARRGALTKRMNILWVWGVVGGVVMVTKRIRRAKRRRQHLWDVVARHTQIADYITSHQFALDQPRRGYTFRIPLLSADRRRVVLNMDVAFLVGEERAFLSLVDESGLVVSPEEWNARPLRTISIAQVKREITSLAPFSTELDATASYNDAVALLNDVLNAWHDQGSWIGVVEYATQLRAPATYDGTFVASVASLPNAQRTVDTVVVQPVLESASAPK